MYICIYTCIYIIYIETQTLTRRGGEEEEKEGGWGRRRRMRWVGAVALMCLVEGRGDGYHPSAPALREMVSSSFDKLRVSGLGGYHSDPPALSEMFSSKSVRASSSFALRI